MISLQHHAQNFIPIRNLSLGQTFNNPFFFFESLTYFVVHMRKLHWKCDLKWLLLDFEKYLLHILLHTATRKNCTENITWSCSLRLWSHLNWRITVLADMPSVIRYVEQTPNSLMCPMQIFIIRVHANLVTQEYSNARVLSIPKEYKSKAGNSGFFR